MAQFISCSVVQAQHYFPRDHIRTSKELPCNYGVLISHFGELHSHPTLSSGQTWMTANNGMVPLEPSSSSSSRCYKTAPGLSSPCPATPHGTHWHHGMAHSHSEETPCGVHETSTSKHPGMTSNPDTNINYSSWFPKNSWYWPFGKYFTLLICTVLFSDLAPWTSRTDQEQQWAFCL